MMSQSTTASGDCPNLHMYKNSMDTAVAATVVEQPTERIIKAKKLKDGFTFQLSIDHIIEQTLLKEYNSPKFRKSMIQIEETANSDVESEDVEYTKTLHTRTKGVPIKLQLKRQFAEDTPCNSDTESLHAMTSYSSSDEPLDMTTKKGKKPSATEIKPELESVTSSIPPCWIMKGLSREDLIKFQSAVSKASLSPYQRRSRSTESI